MTMVFKRGDIVGDIEIREFARFKINKARQETAIRIDDLGMASRRIVERISADYGRKPGWYCLQVRVGSEYTVEKTLADADVQCLVVTAAGYKTVRRGRVVWVNPAPIIRGYVLVRCLPIASAMLGFLRVKHVIDIVGGAVSPWQASDVSVSEFMVLAGEGAYHPAAIPAHDFLEGEMVRVSDGPFASFPALVVSLDKDDKSRVKVEVSIFGRATPVELHIAQIEKL